MDYKVLQTFLKDYQDFLILIDYYNYYIDNSLKLTINNLFQ